MDQSQLRMLRGIPHQGKYIFNIHHHGTDDKHSSNIPYKEKADQIPETDEMSQW